MHRPRAPKTFNDVTAPRDYVPGLGRGAIGFTTQVDIGPALAKGNAAGVGGLLGAGVRTQFGAAPVGYVAGVGRGTGGFGDTKPSGELGDTAADLSDANFNTFDGYQGGLFDSAAYDDADREADDVWDAIDARLKERRKRRHPDLDKKETDNDSQSLPISTQFADLKEKLKTVSYEEWDKLPESNKASRTNQRFEEEIPVSDAIILNSFKKHSGYNESSAVVDADEPSGSIPLSNISASTSLTIERGRMIRDELDKEITKGKDLDIDGYLSSLSERSGYGAHVGDVKKARALLKSVTTSNPTHSPGWIAAARLEEVAGQLLEARTIIASGYEACPQSEEVWIEAARLNTAENAKLILTNAIKRLPRSEKIWLAAAALEISNVDRKKRVLRRGLETIPNSEKLWKALISAEEDEADAHILLARAVECVPHSVDLWLALSKQEEYEQAQLVLNRARKLNPQEPRIWLAACALEEANFSSDKTLEKDNLNLESKLNGIMTKAVQSLSSAGSEISREEWINYAKEMEKSNPLICRAIVRASLKLRLKPEQWLKSWKRDAQNYGAKGHIEITRTLYSSCMDHFSKDKGVIMSAIAFEIKCGDPKSLSKLLNDAVEACPEAEIFWMMAAKETWLTSNDIAGARTFLSRAFKAGHSSERLWVAAVKLEWETGNIENARALLQKARQENPSARVFMKSILLERQQLTSKANISKDRIDVVRKLIEISCKKFSKFAKLWMIAGQFELSFGTRKPHILNVDCARKIYLEGIQNCPNSIVLWGLAAALEEKFVSVAKSRSVFELSRLKNPRNPRLWLLSVQLEHRHGNADMAQLMLSKALQECKNSEGVEDLWAEYVKTATKLEQRSRSADALQNYGDNVKVLTSIASLFAADKKLAPARKWFAKALEADKSWGDAWLAWCQFENKMGDKDSIRKLKKEFSSYVQSKPKLRGPLWLSIAKDDKNFLKRPEEIMDQFVN